MSRSVVIDPVISRTGTTKIVAPEPVRSTSQVVDPVCRTVGATQTAIPEPVE